MSEKNIKGKAIASVFWKLAERLGAQVVSLIVSIVLARILSPKEYSVVSIVLIFFTFANVLISGGLNTALIQKKNADKEDYSTILYVSVFLSLAVYAILFFLAPLIAAFYENSELTLMLRIMGLALPVNAVKAVWCAFISSNLMFRKFFFSTLGGIALSGIIGIIFALGNYLSHFPSPFYLSFLLLMIRSLEAFLCFLVLTPMAFGPHGVIGDLRPIGVLPSPPP